MINPIIHQKINYDILDLVISEICWNKCDVIAPPGSQAISDDDCTLN